MNAVEQRFRTELLDLIAECKKLKYNPSRFSQMIGAKPFEAVRSLLNASETSDGFGTLFQLKRLDLSVEAVVLKPEWRECFTQAERDSARRRLADAGYKAPWDNGDASPGAEGPT